LEYINLWFLGYLVLGVAIGFFAGLLGIGGGAMMVPVLAIMFPAQGFPFETKMQVILATSMATIMFTSISSVRAHQSRGAVNWAVLWAMVPGVLVGTLVGARIVKITSTAFLGIFFICFLFYTATQMLVNVKPNPSRTLPGRTGLFAAGSVLGLLSALVSVGGAFFTIPFMTWCNVATLTAIGTSAALGFPIALFTTIANIFNGWDVPNVPQPSLGYVYLPALIGISITSVLVAPLGARLAHRLPVKSLKRIFALLLYALGLRMLWGLLAS
jgi:uncharacterized protein